MCVFASRCVSLVTVVRAAKVRRRIWRCMTSRAPRLHAASVTPPRCSPSEKPRARKVSRSWLLTGHVLPHGSEYPSATEVPCPLLLYLRLTHVCRVGGLGKGGRRCRSIVGDAVGRQISSSTQTRSGSSASGTCLSTTRRTCWCSPFAVDLPASSQSHERAERIRI